MGGTQQRFTQGGSAARSKPLPFYMPFLTKKVHLYYGHTAEISLPFHILQRQVKPLPFNIPDAWKRYLFRAEPPHIGRYREYPLPLPGSYPAATLTVVYNEPVVLIAIYLLETFPFSVTTPAATSLRISISAVRKATNNIKWFENEIRGTKISHNTPAYSLLLRADFLMFLSF